MNTRLHNKLKHQNGFTLVEVVIVTALFSVLLIGLLNIYDWQQKTYNLETSRINATRAARISMSKFHEIISQGYIIHVEEGFDSGKTQITTGFTELVISIPAIDASGNAIVGFNDVLGFRVSGNTLEMYTSPGHAQSRRFNDPVKQDISHNIKNLNFTYNDGNPINADQITVSITGFYEPRYDRVVSLDLVETIFLRNK